MILLSKKTNKNPIQIEGNNIGTADEEAAHVPPPEKASTNNISPI